VTLGPRVFDSVPLPAGPAGPAAGGRGDIVISGIEHAGPSFELRVFVNNRDATANTPPTPDDGYAGSVYVYGYGESPEHEGDEPYRTPQLPVTRYIIATEALRAAAASGESASISLVPVAFNGPEPDVDLSAVSVAVLVRE
jgi:hypothetical protein